MFNPEEEENRIKETLNKMRPYLNAEGGDIEFVKYENGIVYIHILGACVDCQMLDLDISEGIEAMLIDEVPGVIRVEVI
jgi:Fe-S cluster biogenesis protein NfuA